MWADACLHCTAASPWSSSARSGGPKTSGSSISWQLAECVPCDAQTVTHLLAELQRLYGKRVQVHKHHKLVAIDIGAQQLTYCHQEEQINVKYDLLVGADGVNSFVRQALTQQVLMIITLTLLVSADSSIFMRCDPIMCWLT